MCSDHRAVCPKGLPLGLLYTACLYRQHRPWCCFCCLASGCRVQAMYRAQLQVSRACCCRTAWPNRCCKSFSVKPRGSSEGSLCPGLTPGLPAGRSADRAARRAVLTNLHVCIRKKGLCLSVSHQTELMHLSACFLTFITFSM